MTQKLPFWQYCLGCLCVLLTACSFGASKGTTTAGSASSEILSKDMDCVLSLPRAVPVFSDSTFQYAFHNGETITRHEAMYRSSADLKKIEEFYKAALPADGWKDITVKASNDPSPSVVIQATQDYWDLILSLKQDGSIVQLTYDIDGSRYLHWNVEQVCSSGSQLFRSLDMSMAQPDSIPGWPERVPLIPNGLQQTLHCVPDQGAGHAHAPELCEGVFTSSAKILEVLSFYQRALPMFGWNQLSGGIKIGSTIDFDANRSNNAHMLSLSLQDGPQVTITVKLDLADVRGD